MVVNFMQHIKYQTGFVYITLDGGYIKDRPNFPLGFDIVTDIMDASFFYEGNEPTETVELVYLHNGACRKAVHRITTLTISGVQD